MCLYPQFVPRPQGSAEYISTVLPKGGLKPLFHGQMTVPCGKCPDCRKLRAMHWSFRLANEYHHSFTGIFLTLTYNNEHLPENGKLKREDQKDFLKNLRRQIEYHYDGDDPSFENYGKNKYIIQEQYHRMKEAHWFKERRLKYYWVGEYGTENKRPHYHAIMMNIPRPIIKKIDKIWTKGHIKIGKVNEKSIRYVANYVMQTDYDKDRPDREYATMSMGIGADYIESNYDRLTENPTGSIQYNDRSIPMPRYYRDKIYSDEQKQQIARDNTISYYSREQEEREQCKAKGIDYEQYKKFERELKIERFLKHKKVRKL